MIDIHCHLIHGVDDGPASLEQSVKMVYEAEEAGVKVIYATPHYGEVQTDLGRIHENYQALVSRIRDSNVSIMLGYEVMLSPCMMKTREDLKELSLHGSEYILIELPFGLIPMYCQDVIYNIRLAGMTPVIAHPERSMILLKDIGLLEWFIEKGCLLQVDAGSIAGAFGAKARRFARELVDRNMVEFIASDAHSPGGYCDWYIKAYNHLCSWAGEQYADRLFCSAPKAVLDNSKKFSYEVI